MIAIEHPDLAKWYEAAVATAWPKDSDHLPELLGSLCDTDESTREGALGELLAQLLETDELTAASVEVARQLVALIRIEAAPDKDQLLVALDDLADTASALIEMAEADDEAGLPSDELDDADVEMARQLHAAVLEGTDAMIALLGDADDDTRVCAAFALTGPLAERPREISAALLARLEVEREARVRASVLLALGLSGESPVVESIRASLDGGETMLERMAAAMALIPFFGHLVQDEVILTLINALADPDDLRLAYDELPWADEDLVVDLGALLASFNDGGRCPVLAPIVERLDGCESRSGTLALVEAALLVAFDPHEHEHAEGDAEDHDHDHGHGHDHDHDATAPAPLVDLATLSAPQRELLTRLGKQDRLWSAAVNIGALLSAYGLPGDREALRSAL